LPNPFFQNLQHVGKTLHPFVLAGQLPIVLAQLEEGRLGDLFLVQVSALDHQGSLLSETLLGQGLLVGVSALTDDSSIRVGLAEPTSLVNLVCGRVLSFCASLG